MNITSPIESQPVWLVMLSVNITHMVTNRFMTLWCVWSRTSPCGCRFWTGRAISARSMATRRLRCVTPKCRMAKPAQALLEDIDKDTVDFQDNYDNSEREPVVLPARFPNLLVNGANGIAVGMATNVPPHNLGELVDAAQALIVNSELSDEELLQIVPGPDFPTGALILGQNGSKSAVMTGRGSIVMRGRAAVEEIRKDREAIIITEIPYQVNKASMIEKIAELVREKTIEGIADLRDESDRHGMRVVVELKRDAVPDVVLNQLYRYSQLQTSFRRQYAGA